MTPPPRTLATARCTPCEGGTPPLPREEIDELLNQVSGWTISEDATVIEKKWNCKNFQHAMRFLERIAEIAEDEQHHPDLHLTGYRHVRVVLTTHAAQGLTRNDFIVAAKIDAIPD